MEFVIANKGDDLSMLYHVGGVIRFETFVNRQFYCIELTCGHIEDRCAVKDSLSSSAKDKDFLIIQWGHKVGGTRDEVCLARYFNKRPYSRLVFNKSLCI